MQIETLSQAITPELREWIVAQARAGCAADDILKAMQASGWSVGVARAARRQQQQTTADQLRMACVQRRAPCWI